MAERAIDESVMAGHGEYSRHSRPQHVAAAAAYPLLQRAAAEVVPSPHGAGVQILDMGCAGGQNEMEPMALAIDAVRAGGWSGPVEVVHTDLPENDFSPLFELLESPDSYTATRPGVFPSVIGRSLYGPLVPDGRARLGWSAITLHWLSRMPCVVPDAVFSNLATGDSREALRRQADEDWHVFLTERARELSIGGQLALVAGASDADGRSGAEGLFGLIGEQLRSMVDDGVLRRSESDRIFYPTWNRTLDEWLAPFGSGRLGDAFEVLEHREDVSDDTRTYPQYTEGGDAAALADAYTPFVRAVTAVPFFRALDAHRTAADRDAVQDAFYAGLRDRIRAAPDVAVCSWRVTSLRIRRRT